MTNNNPIHPFPDALRPGKSWKVRAGMPMTHLHDMWMSAPTGNTVYDENCRVHEAKHAAYTDNRLLSRAQAMGISPLSIQACEDARINTIYDGIDISDGVLTPEIEAGAIAKTVQAETIYEKVVSFVASYGYDSHTNKLKAAIKTLPDGEKVLEHYTQCINIIKRQNHSQDSALMAAIYLDKLQEQDAEKATEPNRAKRDPGDMEEAIERLRYGSEWIIEEFRIRESKFDPKRTYTPNKWGVMTIERLRLKKPIRTYGKGFRKSASDEGLIPNRIWNYCSSGNIFTKKAAADGGSLLLDSSGSMSIRTTDVENLIMAAPAATIAIYGGHHPTTKGTGVLRVLVKGGMRVEDRLICPVPEEFGGENVIDGPALEWLGHQDPPRYWVSDGHVSGVQGFSLNMHEDAARICRKYKIVRIPTIHEAIDTLRSNAKMKGMGRRSA